MEDEQCELVPLHALHNKIVAEADEDRSEQAGIWFEEAIVNAMDVVLNSLISKSGDHAFQARWKPR
jgi:hypothetical protein